MNGGCAVLVANTEPASSGMRGGRLVHKTKNCASHIAGEIQESEGSGENRDHHTTAKVLPASREYSSVVIRRVPDYTRRVQ